LTIALSIRSDQTFTEMDQASILQRLFFGLIKEQLSRWIFYSDYTPSCKQTMQPRRNAHSRKLQQKFVTGHDYARKSTE